MPDAGATKNDIGYDWFSAPEASTDYMSSAEMGNALYAAFGDSYIVFNDNDKTGNAYVRVFGRDWYTTSVTKGDWLYRKYGDSFIVYNNEGYPYARYDGDWYVSCLPRKEYAPNRAENTIIKLDDSSSQAIMPEANKGTAPLIATNKSDFSLGSLSSTNYPQSDFSEYLDFTRKIQDHIGHPELPTSQEIKNNISWEVGPFDAFYKYKNGIMIPEHQEKLNELQNAWEFFTPSKYLIPTVGFQILMNSNVLTPGISSYRGNAKIFNRESGKVEYTSIRFTGTTRVGGELKDISRKVYQRNDINWNRIDPESGLTNAQLVKKGKPPYWEDGTKVELHHLTQIEPGPMVELPASLHDKYSRILHGLAENGGSFRNNLELEKQYNNFRVQYWKWRAETLE